MFCLQCFNCHIPLKIEFYMWEQYFMKKKIIYTIISCIILFVQKSNTLKNEIIWLVSTHFRKIGAIADSNDTSQQNKDHIIDSNEDCQQNNDHNW